MAILSLPEAHRPLGKALLDATKEVFLVQLNTPVVFANDTNGIQDALAVKALLAFNGPVTAGLCTLGFTHKTFCAVYSKLLGETCANVTDENADSAAELLNMVFGVFKAKVNQFGHSFSPALPVVLRGTKMNVDSALGNNPQKIACMSDIGHFFMEFNLSNKIG